MVWTRTSKDGKPRYIRREGDIVLLTKDKSRANCNSVPEGWEVVTLPNGHIKIRKKR